MSGIGSEGEADATSVVIQLHTAVGFLIAQDLTKSGRMDAEMFLLSSFFAVGLGAWIGAALGRFVART